MKTKRRSTSFVFSAGENEYGISIEVDPDAPGGGTIAIYSKGSGPMADTGTALTLHELRSQSLPGPEIPADTWRRVNEFIYESAQPQIKTAAVAVHEGEVVERFSWEEGNDWEFYYYIDIYHNGALFTASGELERGITPQSEFQAFDREGGIVYPRFMSTGGEYFRFAAWLKEYNELDQRTR